ncbi:hypothetical protein CVS28_03715 [Arthrobacter glacialis]|nr:hypothetical protein CVS28_03715 [Arthrobacter glacialis]
MNVDRHMPARLAHLRAGPPPASPRAPRRIALGVTVGLAAMSLGMGMAPAAPTETTNRYEVVPGSPVLISEIANGGAGASATADRVSAKNFIELSNYGDTPMDISGWKIYRCGQTGDGYGPQSVVPENTVLAPGDQFTTARDTSGYTTDASYDTSLHEFGYGAFIEDAKGQRRDAVGVYHPDVNSDCAINGVNLRSGLDHRLDESFQRVSANGPLADNWIIATRTVDAPNATAGTRKTIDNGLRFTELSNGGAGNAANQYVEVTNFSTTPVDMSSYSLFRCGENGTAYSLIPKLPAGSVVAAGDSFVFSNSKGAQPAGGADLTFAAGIHWRDFGVMLVTASQEIVDRAGVYNNRNSVCTDGSAIKTVPDHYQNEVLTRVSNTGDNSADFALTTTRTPGSHGAQTTLATAAKPATGDVQISEIAASGAAGADDEFFELANYGATAVNLKGWSAYRCTNTGQGSATPQIADLGDITLAPGQVYLASSVNAPAIVRDVSNASYATGLDETDYGVYLMDAAGAKVDAMAAYDVDVDRFTPCRLGQETRNYTKPDQGQSYQRAQHTGDNENDFVIAATRTPGILNDVSYVDPTVPLAGELDPTTVSTNNVPGTPKLTVAGGSDLSATVSGTDDGGTTLALKAESAELKDSSAVVVHTGSSTAAVPATLEIPGETIARKGQQMETSGAPGEFPFQRFELPVASGEPANFSWSGTTSSRNEIQMYAWDSVAAGWMLLTTAVPSADGDLTLNGTVPEDKVKDGVAQVLVIDGPRTSGGLIDEIGVTDQAFANPASYDFSLNHMTDPQFYSESFRDVFRKMSSWVVSNADSRKVAYNSLTGDIIQNWIAGNSAEERANREYAAARKIMSLINDANIPNGVLPGNHDNFWGRDNSKFNEYFPVEMYQDKEWYGESWQKGDNAAHTDFFSHEGMDFMVLNLPYRSSAPQLAWASAQAAAHPAHNIIIATHSYLHTAGTRDNIDARYTSSAQETWDTVIAPHDNVFLVLGGHYHGVVTNYADPVTGEQTDATELARDTYAIKNVGGNRRTVVEMLADYQGYRSSVSTTRNDLLDRDSGFQRLLQLDLDAGLMAVNAYSPSLDSFEAWKYDEPAYRGATARYDAGDDEFVAQVSLIRSTTLKSSQWAQTGSFSEFAQGTLENGGQQNIALATGAKEQLWTVSLTDPEGNVSRSTPRVLAALAATPTATATATATSSVPGAGTSPTVSATAIPGAATSTPGNAVVAGGEGSDELVATGANVGIFVTGAVLLLLAGAGVLMGRNRRASSHS